MSLVSAFAAIPQDITQAKPPATEPGQAATSFAQLLDDPKDGNKKETQKTPEHPAYSFAELGMFGLHADQFADDTQTRPSDPKASAAKTLVHMSATGEAPAPAQIAAAVSLVTIPFLDGEISTSSPRVDTVPAGTAIAGSNVAVVSTPAKTPSAAKVSDTRSASAQANADPAKPSIAQTAQRAVADKVSVVVSGPDEALQVAVRTPNEALTEVAKLRRLIETTVAHFEMDMAELHFNGTSIDTAFSLGGGADGGSAR